MNLLTEALLAAIATLLVALGLVGWVAHSRGVDLAQSRDRVAVLEASVTTYSNTQKTNLATIAELRAANSANSDAAVAAKKLADNALAAVTSATVALGKAQAENARIRREQYANDATLRAWGDVPLPRVISDRLRASAGVLTSRPNGNGDGVPRSLSDDRPEPH